MKVISNLIIDGREAFHYQYSTKQPPLEIIGKWRIKKWNWSYVDKS